MITIYRVTLNGSPVPQIQPCTLLAAAYTAASLAVNAPSDLRGDRKVCVYDVEPVDVQQKLTRQQRDTDRMAQSLAYIAGARLSTVAVGLIVAHEPEAEELVRQAEAVERLAPAV